MSAAALIHAHRTIPPEREAYEPPRADSPERYPGRTQQEKARLIRAEVQLISRFMRCDLNAVAWRCHLCGGRVDISGKTTNTIRAQVISTRGKCRTSGCLDWED